MYEKHPLLKHFLVLASVEKSVDVLDVCLEQGSSLQFSRSLLSISTFKISTLET